MPDASDIKKEDQEKLQEAQDKSPLAGFFEFIRQQGVVGLAVGFILGDSVKQVVSSIVNDLINPVLGLVLVRITGGNLEDASFNVGPVIFTWGHLASTLIDFVIIAAVIYFVIKGLKLDKLDLPKK